MTRPLVVAAHGTASRPGRRVLEEVTAAAAARLGVRPLLGYVDVVGPRLEQLLDGLSGAVVVPLFLATGHHVRVDVPAAVREAAGAVATPAVGSGEEVLDALEDRVRAVLAADPDRPADGVLLAAAGSSDVSARGEVTAAAAALARRLGVPVAAAFLTGPPPTPEDGLATLAAAGAHEVVVASHLLAPGHFQTRLEERAAGLGLRATAPVGAHPRVVDAVVARYRAATSA